LIALLSKYKNSLNEEFRSYNRRFHLMKVRKY